MQQSKTLISTLITSLSFLFVFQASTSFAQDNNSVEEVVVTGSRIFKDPLNEPAPVLDITEDALERTGLTNLGTILQQLPITGSAINTRFNVPGNSGFPQDGTGIGAGAVQVALRNLGAKRTLVLVDGKRWVAGASASGVPSAVDMNTIPANTIKKIEVLQDGASAIYGSDAIGGVINIITHDDFEGLKIDSHLGGYLSDSDGESYDFSALWGGGSDKTKFILSANYSEEQEIFTSSRAQSAFPSPFGTSCLDGGCSSFTPQARFLLGPNFNFIDVTLNDGVLNDGGVNIPDFDPLDPFAGDFHQFSAADRFNFNGQNFNYLQTPNERFNTYAKVTHEFSDSLRVSTKLSYTNRQSTTTAAPEPLCLGSGCGNRILDNIVIDADQIYNPFNIDLSVANGNLEFFGRRPLESGPRIFVQDVDTFFVTSGLEGDFSRGGHDYYWDLTASYGDNQGFQQKFGAHNAAKLAVALGDPDVCAATPNCVPFNFFGGQGPDGSGSITQEMLDFVGYIQRDFSEQTQSGITGNITGDLMQMAAGDLAFAAGFEHRNHDGSFQPDPIAARGETAGIPSGPTAGGFDVTELYAEFNIPLLSGVAGADFLELNVAGRTSDYSTSGAEQTYKFGALWRPIEDLSVRGSISTGIRAPGIGELFGGAAREDFTFLDPCADVLGLIPVANGGRLDNVPGSDAQSTLIQNNCATLGVPVDFAQRNPQLSAISAGNTNLVPETSDNLSVGVVYSPSWVDNSNWADRLTLSLDYYEIEIESAVQGRDPGDIISACVDTLDDLFCDAVERTQTGLVNLVDNQLQNIGGIDASGLDVAVNYRAPEMSYGQFGVSVNATHLSDYTERTANPDGSFAVTDRTGTLTNETFQRAFPEWRVTTKLDWNRDRWGAGLTFRSVGDLDQPSGNVLDSRTFTDLRVQYSPALYNDAMTFTIGANNILDKDPAVCDSCGTINMSQVVHDIPGVVGYAKVSVRFD